MRLVVISPEAEDAREVPAMAAFFAAGLARYHVRKAGWTRESLEAWLRALPEAWRPRIFLHQHHGLAAALGLGGAHVRDGGMDAGGASRACHDLPSLARCLPLYPQVILGPVFDSISKPGYGPGEGGWDGLTRILSARRPSDARVLAVGGVTAARLGRCRDMGFDGAALFGCVWGDPDPAAAFVRARDAAARLEGARHAA